ncbi:MAG TPA: hypothetical protein VNJ02_14520 [Vicinamibacterales bacterium]|nr:hypothetical protein [Vicinamibacterales bacterium]
MANANRAARRRPQNAAEVRVGHGRKPLALRERAIVALLTASSIKHAATRAGVNEKTLREWLKCDVEFRAAFDAAHRAAFEEAKDQIRVLATRAVATLGELLDAKVPPAIRFAAARDLLDRNSLRPVEKLEIVDSTDLRALDAAAFAEHLRGLTNAAYQLAAKEQHRSLEGKSHDITE